VDVDVLVEVDVDVDVLVDVDVDVDVLVDVDVDVVVVVVRRVVVVVVVVFARAITTSAQTSRFPRAASSPLVELAMKSITGTGSPLISTCTKYLCIEESWRPPLLLAGGVVLAGAVVLGAGVVL
jgi:hypothetical protein